jgi:dCTP deaminase
MSNTKELLLLHLSHAKQALEKAKNNSYSDQRKEKYQQTLFDLFELVEDNALQNLDTFKDQEIYDGPKKHLDFIIKSLQFLDSSTFNQIPYEIVECLKYAMADWESTDKFIIVTSLINDLKGFSYEGWLANDDNLYNDIQTKYPSIKFDHRLVLINLPKALARDYLVNVVLYHELGHFIDRKNFIAEALLSSILDGIFKTTFSPPELAELKSYLPNLSGYIDDPARPDWNPLFALFYPSARYLMEYFSDLFAAQYVGKMSSLYVTYLDSNKSVPGVAHPTAANRQKVVNDFLNNTPNLMVAKMQESINKTMSKPLQKRFVDVEATDFFNLVPTILNSAAEMHGILHKGWDIWLNFQNVLKSNLKTSDPSRVYSVINNLIEKSIGSYISVGEWNRVKPTVARADEEQQLQEVKKTELKNILTKKQIQTSIREKKLYIRPLLDSDQIGEAGIDFRLGYDFLVSVQGRDAFMNASKNDWINGGQRRNIKQFFQSSRRQLGETFILHPRQTVLAVTLEYVRLPDDCMLMLFMRSSYARLGLTISTIAQPGYCGCLSLEFTNTNNNPINLAVGARIIQGILCPVGGSTEYLHTQRKYVCHVRPEPSAVINDKDLTFLNELWKLNNERP